MRASNRIALPLSVAFHLLAFYVCGKLWRHPQPIQIARSNPLTVYLIPALPTEQANAKMPALMQASAQTARPRRPAAPTNIMPPQAISNPLPVPDAIVTSLNPKSELKPPPIDPVAMVHSYRYEDSKSDLQKMIEAGGGNTETIKKSKYEQFEEAAEFASVPGCLGQDALKHNPPHIGPVALGGIFALPFLAEAAVTGKCK